MAVTGENSLLFKTGLDNSGLLQGKNQAVGIISNMASTIGRINPFLGLATAGTLAFAGISRGAYKMAKEFETAMKEVETISTATQQNFDAIAQKVFDISKISPDAPKELANAYYQIVSAGYDGAEGLKLLEVASKGAIAGVTSTKVSADGLTTVMNAFRIGVEDAERVSDVFFNTVKLGKTTMEELASNISTVAPLASASGVSFEEVASAIASLTKQGVPTAQAMTQVRSALNALNENLSEGWSNSITFQEGLQLLYEKADGSKSALLELTGRVEGMSAVLGIAGDNLKTSVKDLESYKDAVGATAEAQNILLNDTGNQWSIFSNRLKGTLKNMGDGWNDLSQSLAKGLNTLLDDGVIKSDALTTSFNEQRLEVFKLKGELAGLNEESDERKQFIEDMKVLYPDFLSDLSKEKISNEDLLDILDKVNESYKTRFKLEKRAQELKGEIGKQQEIVINIENIEDEFKLQLAKIETEADRRGLKIKIDYDAPKSNIIEDVRKQIHAFEISKKNATNTGLVFDTQLVKMERSLRGINDRIKPLNVDLEAQNEIVQKLTERNDRLYKEDLKNIENRKKAINQINSATSFDDIEQYKKTGFADITKAYQDRAKVIEKIEEISNIKKKENLTKYLNSELEEIRNFAEARRKALSVEVVGDEDGGGAKKTQFQLVTESLKQVEGQYKILQKIRQNGNLKDVESFKKAHNLKYDSYKEFLSKLLAETKKGSEKYFAILNQISTPKVKARIDFEFKADPKKSFVAQSKAIEKQADKTSKNLVNVERTASEKLIVLRKERTRAYNDMTTEELQAEKDKIKGIIKAEKDKPKEERDRAGIKSAKKDLFDVNQALSGMAQEMIANAVAGLQGAADLFQKFGNEEMAELFRQFSGVVEGVGEIFKGNVVGGIFQILNSALTVTVESDTEKFEKQIDKLGDQLEKVYRELARAIGDDKIKGRIDALQQELDLQILKEQSVQAELDARKEVKFLGVTVGSKGKGSGTDVEKLEELRDSLTDTQEQILDIKDEIKNLLTGTTSSSITDAIIDGFAEGKDSITDFTETFEDLMRGAIVNAFKLKAVEKLVQPFFDEFSRLSDDNGDGNFDLTSGEINQLRSTFNGIYQRSVEELEALNQILEGAGISGGAFGSAEENKTGLSGAIKNITEDTANVLAGTLNQIRLDVRESLDVAENSLAELIEIRKNTEYNKHLETMNDSLEEIKTSLA